MTALSSNKLPVLETGVSVSAPSCWCETADGKLIRVNGLQRGTIWNGLDKLTALGITAPTVAPTVAAVGSGASLDASYWLGYRYIDDEGIPSSLSPLTEVDAAENDAFNWTAIPRSTEARVDDIQLFRSTGDQADVLYRIATVSNPVGAPATYTSAQDNDDDDTLRSSALADVLPILNDDATLHARRFEPPPDHKTVVVPFQDRYFYFGETLYDESYVTSGDGQTFMAPVNSTEFTSDMVGRYLWVDGGDEPKIIGSVPNDYTIALTGSFTGLGSAPLRYAIRSDAGEGNRIYYSETDEPESVPPSQNALDLQEDPNDHGWITTGFPHGSVLWIFRPRQAFRLRFIVDPAIDGSIKLAASRGCLNQRCWAKLGDTVYLFDEQGPWWIGPSGAQQLGNAVQDYFRNMDVDYGFAKWFYVSVNRQESVVRFHFVLSTDTGTRPKAALCYQVERQVWWLETYPVETCGGGQIDSGVKLHTVIGGPDGKALVLGDGTSDLCVATGQGEIHSGLQALVDNTARFQSGSVGSTMVIDSPMRPTSAVVTAIKNAGLALATPLSVAPASGDTFTLDGGSYVVAYATTNTIVAHPNLDVTEEFTSSVVGETVTMTSGAADTETANVSSLFAPVALLTPPLRAGDYISGWTAHYWIQQSMTGTVTAAGATTLTDNSTYFPDHVAGSPIAIIAGTGKGQMRIVSSGAGGSTLSVTEAWTTTPDTTSQYMLGAIELSFRSGRYEIPITDDDGQQGPKKPSPDRALLLTYEPTAAQQLLDLRMYYDHDSSPVVFPQGIPRQGPLRAKAGQSDAVLDLHAQRSPLGDAPGVARLPFHGRANERVISNRFLAAELHGFQGPEEVTICALEIEGAD